MENLNKTPVVLLFFALAVFAVFALFRERQYLMMLGVFAAGIFFHRANNIPPVKPGDAMDDKTKTQMKKKRTLGLYAWSIVGLALLMSVTRWNAGFGAQGTGGIDLLTETLRNCRLIH